MRHLPYSFVESVHTNRRVPHCREDENLSCTRSAPCIFPRYFLHPDLVAALNSPFTSHSWHSTFSSALQQLSPPPPTDLFSCGALLCLSLQFKRRHTYSYPHMTEMAPLPHLFPRGRVGLFPCGQECPDDNPDRSCPNGKPRLSHLPIAECEWSINLHKAPFFEEQCDRRYPALLPHPYPTTACSDLRQSRNPRSCQTTTDRVIPPRP